METAQTEWEHGLFSSALLCRSSVRCYALEFSSAVMLLLRDYNRPTHSQLGIKRDKSESKVELVQISWATTSCASAQQLYNSSAVDVFCNRKKDLLLFTSTYLHYIVFSTFSLSWWSSWWVSLSLLFCDCDCVTMLHVPFLLLQQNYYMLACYKRKRETDLTWLNECIFIPSHLPIFSLSFHFFPQCHPMHFTTYYDVYVCMYLSVFSLSTTTIIPPPPS